MEDELRALRDLVTQLKADNNRLHQECSQPVSDAGAGPLAASTTPIAPSARSNSGVERLIFVPRDRNCPMFRDRLGIGLGEWLEETEACMRARHLAPVDQVYFVFDHLEGKARD